MLKKIFLITTAIILMAGCSYSKKPDKYYALIPLPPTPITQTYELKPFKNLIVKGSTNLQLKNGPYSISFIDLPNTLKNYSMQIAKQTLYVDASFSNTKNLTLTVPGLKSITVNDNAIVTTKNFKTDNLTILAQGNGSLNLEGSFSISNIYQRGNGRIDINWIDSDKLFIDSSANGPIYLAGNASNMIAKLTANATLEARYLRTQKASVFTTDRATANILALDTLGGFAIDNSNIYYYKHPKHLTVVTKGSGNVLHPDWVH